MLRIRRAAIALTVPAVVAASLLSWAGPLAAVTPVATPAISAPPDVVVGEADGYVDLVVSLSAPGTSTVTVHYSTANNTAQGSNGCDYDFSPAIGTLSFLPGETTKTVRVDIYDCADVEGLESFTLNLSSQTSATIARGIAKVDIVDNDTVVATPRLSVRDAVVDEKAGSVAVPVLLGGPAGQASAGTVTVHYATSNAGATAGSDYTATSGTLTFGPGETAKNVIVAITDDGLAEPAERIGLTLSSPVGATILDGKEIVVIGPSDATKVATPAISAPPDVVVGEADGYVDLVVSLSAPGTSTVTVHYSTANNTAQGSNGCDYDFSPAIGTLSFLPGETTKTVRVDIYDCADVEGLESFTLNLSSQTSATIARGIAKVDIVDNDTVVATPRLSVRDAVVDEKAGSVAVPVLLGGPAGQASAGTVTVHYATSNAGATAGSDYTATSGTLTFGPGETAKNVIVAITDDGLAEPAERIGLTLSSPVGATILDGKEIVVIGPSDATKVATPAISAPPDVVVGEADGYVDLVVSLSAPGTSTVTVHYSTANNTAQGSNGCDYDFSPAIGTLSFLPGETTKTVRVDIYDCADVEGLESFTLNLSSQTSATIARGIAKVDIVDNDSGVDVFSYGISNDIYTVVSLSDVIVENPGGGTDLVMTSLTYTLKADLENLTLTGGVARNGTGNSASNKLIGNSAANKLSGLGGNDTLDGAGGADTLTGGTGSDTITGGTGADIIVFNSLVGSDTVTDFDHAQDTFQFIQSGIHIGDGDAAVDGAVTRGAPGGFSKNAELVIFSSNIVGGITATAAAAKIGSATSAYATGDDRLFVVDNGTETGIFRFHSSGVSALVSPSELTRIALADYAAGTTSTTLSDYVFAP